MRVMQIMAGALHGGAETYFVDLVSGLHRAGLDQIVVIRRNPGRAEALERHSIYPVELPFGGMFDFTTRRKLARLIRETKPDIVHSWMNRATRFVPSRDGTWPFVHVGWFGGYYKVANYRHCDHLVGVTPDIRAHQVAGGWPDDRAHYIPTFAATRKVPPVPRESLETPEGAPVILALGRLHWKKAFDILIRAMADVPEAYLWLAGEGELRAELEELARRVGAAERIRFLGWRDDREALLAASDLCVMPSRYEPFGTVMIEAWAQDVPLIAAAAAGPKGLIRSGENGVLVPIDDVAALSAAMRQVLQDKEFRQRIVAGARVEFDARFTEQAVVGQYRAFYADCLKGSSA